MKDKQLINAFEEWYYNEDTAYWELYELDSIQMLNETPNAMQWGVLQDFYDSVDVYIEICKTPSTEIYYYMINDSSEENSFDTRPEARTQSLIKAEEIWIKNNGKG